MQNIYLGNNHDYVKFALLRHIHRKIGLSIGVNWYLNPTPPKPSKPTENPKDPRAFLDDPDWECLDPDLLERLAPFKNKGKRQIECVPNMCILPKKDTCYFSVQMPKPLRKEARQKWHKCARNDLEKAKLIFLDPDTGFQPSFDKSSPRHALYSEAVDWLKDGKHVVIYQAATREKGTTVTKQAKAVRANLHRCAKARCVEVVAPAPVILGRSDPNVLLVTISPKREAGKAKKLKAELESFVREICDRKECKTGKRTRKKCKIKLVP